MDKGNHDQKQLLQDQTVISIKKNTQFFLEEHSKYKQKVATIDTYLAISDAINFGLSGCHNILDIGNGGVFDYNTALLQKIIGLDLFLDALPKDTKLPENVKMVQGSALDIPKELVEFDAVLMVMLIHHLIGETVSSCFQNMRKAIDEAYRVLRPGGKLIIVDSCIPTWFFRIEKVLYKPTCWLIERTMKHPPAFQFTREHISGILEKSGFHDVNIKAISKGKFILQLGIKVPSFITPTQPTLFLGIKQE